MNDDLSFRFGDRVKLTSHEAKELVGMTGKIREVLFSTNPPDMHLRVDLGSDIPGGEPIEVIVGPNQVERL